MSKNSALNPRRKPRQKRSLATFNTILDAAIRVLSEVGHHRLTTTRVADRAGISVGSFYQYFPNKQVLMAELAQRYKREVLAELSAHKCSLKAPPEVNVRRLVQTLIRRNLVNAKARRELIQFMRANNWFSFAETVSPEDYAVFMDLLSRHPVTRNLANPRMKVLMLCVAVGALIDEFIATDPETFGTKSFEVEVTRLILGFLFCDADIDRSSSPYID